MARRMSAYEARVHFGELLNRVHYQGEEFIIEKMGKPVARLVGVAGPAAGGDWRATLKRYAGTIPSAEGAKMLRVVAKARRDSRSARKLPPLA